MEAWTTNWRDRRRPTKRGMTAKPKCFPCRRLDRPLDRGLDCFSLRTQTAERDVGDHAREDRGEGKADTHRSSGADENMATAIRARSGRA
jgi:hypothetical protein